MAIILIIFKRNLDLKSAKALHVQVTEVRECAQKEDVVNPPHGGATDTAVM